MKQRISQILPMKSKLFWSVNWIQLWMIFCDFHIFQESILNQLSCQIGCFFAVNMPALTYKCTWACICKMSAVKQGRPWGNTPPPRPQSMVSRQRQCCMAQLWRYLIHLHQQHLLYQAHTSKHTHIIRTLLKPPNCSPKAHQEGQRQLTPVAVASLGCYCSILRFFGLLFVLYPTC